MAISRPPAGVIAGGGATATASPARRRSHHRPAGWMLKHHRRRTAPVPPCARSAERRVPRPRRRWVARPRWWQRARARSSHASSPWPPSSPRPRPLPGRLRQASRRPPRTRMTRGNPAAPSTSGCTNSRPTRAKAPQRAMVGPAPAACNGLARGVYTGTTPGLIPPPCALEASSAARRAPPRRRRRAASGRQRQRRPARRPWRCPP